MFFFSSDFTGNLCGGTEEGVPLWVPRHLVSTLPMNKGDMKMYEWLDDGRNFSGVIKHKGESLDEENTFVDYFS
jgi:hypothetical protein